MGKSVRAKFFCNSVQESPEYKNKTVNFFAVITGSEENKSFAKLTPSGNLSMVIDNETPAADAFTPGKEYYLTLEEA